MYPFIKKKIIIKEDIIKDSIKDKNLEKNNLNASPLSYKFKNKTVGEIINDFKENKMENSNINFINNNLIISDSLELLAIIFLEPIEVIYKPLKAKDNEKDICDKEVYSTIQIDEMLKKFSTCQAVFNLYGNNYSYFEHKTMLLGKNKITIYYLITPYKFVHNTYILKNSTKNIKKYELSKYFGAYFKYDKINKTKEFDYYISEERNNLSENFYILKYEEAINKFKIAGPSNSGKSTTLLYLSRTSYNIIYLNLKIINLLFYESNVKTCLELLMYEFGRLNLEDNKLKNKFEQIFNENIEQPPWIIIEKITEFLLESNIKFILILDEFKSSYVDSVFYQKLEKKLNNKFKIIISFTINDNNDFNNIVNSLEINKGNPSIFLENTQNYYFYYSNLLNKENLRKLYENDEQYNNYELFNFSPKYIYLLDYYKVIYIKLHIIEYLKNHCEKNGIKEFNSYLLNFYKGINVNFSFNDIYNIAKIIPMKYCYLEFGNNCFKIKYSFNYLETIINDTLKLDKIREYFIESKDEDDYFNDKFKCDFFESSAVKTIKERHNLYFKNKIKYFLTVDDLISLRSYNKQKIINDLLGDSINIKKLTIKKEKYFEMTIDLLEKELNDLKHLYNDINSYIFHSKYKVYSQEKELLNKKRFPEKEDFKDKKNKFNIRNKSNSSKDENKIDDSKEYVDFFEYSDDFRNSGILIQQKNSDEKILDLGVLLGPWNKKIFVGFRMNYFAEGTYIKNDKDFTKEKIRESIQPILLNFLKEFNIRITSWHYIICLYYNPKEINSYNASLINSCNKSDIELILYDPYEEIFYSRDFIPIKDEINLTYRSNLDCSSSTNPYIIFNNNEHMEYYSNQRTICSHILSGEKNIFKISKSEFFSILKSIMGKDKDFEMIYKFNYCWKYPFPIPKRDYLFLFNGKQDNQDNNYIYYYNINDNEYICGNIKGEIYDTGKISNFVECPKGDYIEFYVFKFFLIKNKISN